MSSAFDLLGFKKKRSLSNLIYTVSVVILTFILFVVIPTRIYDEWEHKSLHPEGLEIGPNLNVHFDLESEFKPVDLVSRPPELRQVFQGNTWLDVRLSEDPVWLSFPISLDQEDTPGSGDMYVELGFSILNDVRFYLLNSQGEIVSQQQAGNLLRETERSMPMSHPVFAFRLLSNESHTVVIRIESDSFLNTSITASTGKQALLRTHHLNFFLGIFYGCLGMIFFYNLFILILTRRSSYLYYVLSVFSLFLYQGVVDGVIGQYFWHELNWGLYKGLVFFAGFANLMALLFVREILRLQDYAPVFDKWVGKFVIVLSLSFLVELFFPSNFSSLWMLATASAFCLLVPVLGIVAWQKGSPLARSYFITWLSYPILVMVYVLCMAGVLPTNYDTLNSLRVGTAIQAVLMSFALAYYISELRAKKSDLQKALYEELQQQINSLSKTAKLLSQGNYSVRSALPSDARLENLAHDMDSLASTLEQSQIQRQHWLADISHELRTPLTIFRGSLESMQDGVLPMDRHTLQPLVNESVRIGRLVDDLHDIALLESKEMKLYPKPFSLKQVINDVVESYSDKLDDKNIEVVIQFKPEQTEAMADRDRIQQVFVNLMTNTLKYTSSPGKLEITVDFIVNYFVVKWKDSAPGVGEKELPHLFSRLYRSDPSRNRKTGGAGLGLALCQSIVENSGGSIRALPSNLGGVQVELQLPATKQEEHS